MDSQVRVGSIDRFQDFRAAYAKFGDSARNVLLGVEIEIRRMLDWLEKDQVAFWKAEIRRCEEKVNEAKGALHRKRITATHGNIASDTDEQIALRKAKARLEHAEAKLKTVKQWYDLIEEEIVEYRGPSQILGNLLDADVPRAVASLDRMLDAIEGYLSIRAPTLEGPGAVAAGIAQAASVAASEGAPPPTTAPAVPDAEGTDAAAEPEDREGVA